MKTIIPLVLALAIFSPIHAQQIEKTFAKSFNIDGVSTFIMQVNGDVTVQRWGEPQARVQMTVSLGNGTETMLRSLLQAGRYNIAGALANGEFLVQLPGMAREVKINGQALAENLRFELFLPEGVMVDVRSTSTTGL